MNENAILYPLVAWLLLALVVSVRLGVFRVRDFTARQLSPQAYALRTGRTALSEATERTSDHYENLFEMPVIFIAATLTIHVAGLSDITYVATAWLYVGLRTVHTLIHLTYNRVYHRFLVFIASFIPLAFLVMRLAWQLIDRGMS